MIINKNIFMQNMDFYEMDLFISAVQTMYHQCIICKSNIKDDKIKV